MKSRCVLHWWRHKSVVKLIMVEECTAETLYYHYYTSLRPERWGICLNGINLLYWTLSNRTRDQDSTAHYWPNIKFNILMFNRSQVLSVLLRKLDWPTRSVKIFEWNHWKFQNCIRQTSKAEKTRNHSNSLINVAYAKTRKENNK